MPHTLLFPPQVTGVVGRAETLSSIFFIASLLAYSLATRKLLPRNHQWGSGIHPVGPTGGAVAQQVQCTLCHSASTGGTQQQQLSQTGGGVPYTTGQSHLLYYII